MASFSYSVLFLILNLLISSALLEASAQKGPGKGALVGGWQPISDLKDKNIVEIAKFAIDEHKNKTFNELTFLKVIKGEQQVVNGVNYRLVISANELGSVSEYEAVVYDQPWEMVRKLTSFKKVE